MARVNIRDSWRTVRAQFEDDDLDTVFRFRTELPEKRVRSKYRNLIIFKWPYPAKKDGMPYAAVLKQMGSFEDQLEAAVESSQIGIQAVCLTGNGRRTWRYYVADKTEFLTATKPLLRAFHPAVRVFRQKDDPNWELLAEILPLLDCPH